MYKNSWFLTQEFQEIYEIIMRDMNMQNRLSEDSGDLGSQVFTYALHQG